MEITSRPYRGLQDFLLMTSILALGRKISPQVYYVHIGDLSWWLFYNAADPTDWMDRIQVWERDGHICGWSLVDPDWSSFDLFLHPEICGTEQAKGMLDATIQQAMQIVKQKEGHLVRTMWVSEHDHNLRKLLLERGFSEADSFMWYLERPMDIPIPSARLPQDFLARAVRGEEEGMKRAAASYSAFHSSRAFEEYWPRYQRFMRSPVYNPNFDLVTESPDGQFASFCIIWPDPVNHVGLFEPVGAQAAFQGQGLGKAVVLAGLEKLCAWGMDRAMVCVEHDNHPAERLYQSVGFERKFKLLTFVKSV
jgi:ribosomal protein S18 acetylase RimI-like enzyme